MTIKDLDGFSNAGVGEGLKPLPRGKRDFGKKDSWKEGASKPPVALRAGGISLVGSTSTSIVADKSY